MLESDGTEIPYEEWPTRQAVTGTPVVGREVLVELPDATTVPLIINAAPLRGAEGELPGAVAGFQDITHLFEVNRLKDEFVSTVSHELRTPLTSIKGSLQLVLADPESVPDAEYHQLLTVALTNTERLIRLINDTLDISKIAPEPAVECGEVRTGRINGRGRRDPRSPIADPARSVQP